MPKIEKEVLKTANYIFSKEENNQVFTKLEYEIVEFLTTINNLKPKVIEYFKFIYENRNDIENFTKFIKIIEKRGN
jgi:hypothetical protein